MSTGMTRGNGGPARAPAEGMTTNKKRRNEKKEEKKNEKKKKKRHTGLSSAVHEHVGANPFLIEVVQVVRIDDLDAVLAQHIVAQVSGAGEAAIQQLEQPPLVLVVPVVGQERPRTIVRQPQVPIRLVGATVRVHWVALRGGVGV